MAIQTIAHKLDLISLKIWSIRSSALALEQAVYKSKWGIEAFEGAFHALLLLCTEAEDEHRAAVAELFDELRSEKQKGGLNGKVTNEG